MINYWPKNRYTELNAKIISEMLLKKLSTKFNLVELWTDFTNTINSEKKIKHEILLDVYIVTKTSEI